jgi:hypothetical protein
LLCRDRSGITSKFIGMNILKLKSLETEQINNNVIVEWACRLEFVLEIKCDEHENLLGSFLMKTSARSMDGNEALRIAIEKFLNHKYYIARLINAPICDCDPIFNNVRYDFSSCPPDLKYLFEELFKDGNWHYEKELTKETA